LPLSLLRTGANQSPKGARATDWPTIRSTTLLTADPESGARKSAFSRPAHSHISLDSTCFEVQGVSGSKPSDLPGPASRVPPRGGAAEVRHCPVPVRCSGWGSVPGSAAPGPCVTPWLHVRRDRGCTAAVTKVGRRSGRGLLLRMRPMPGHVFCGHGPPPAPEPLGSRAPAHAGARRGPEHPRPSRPNHCTDCHRACSCASDPASGM
jgi:hypothetical protein